MLEELPKPAVIAHRGASAYAPENTLAAFKLAVQQQADAIELDVTLSADDHVVIFHDKTLDRTTDGQGSVSNLPLAALRELDAGSFYDVSFRRERIPTLGEVFETVGKKIFINIELKSNSLFVEKLVKAVVKCVKEYNMSSRVLFSSFNFIALKQTAKLLPEVPNGLLSLTGFASACAHTWFKGLIPHQSLHISLQDARQGLIDRAHGQGCCVFAYTINRTEDIQRLLNLGIDGMFTNDPPLAIRTIAMQKAK